MKKFIFDPAGFLSMGSQEPRSVIYKAASALKNNNPILAYSILNDWLMDQNVKSLSDSIQTYANEFFAADKQE